MISTTDCTGLTGNLQSRHGESAFIEQLLPFACNNSSKGKSPNMHNKLWLNTITEEQSPPISCFQMSYAKMKSMPDSVHGYAKYVTEEDDCSRTTIPVSDNSSSEDKDMDHRDAIVAACHLLLLSNSFQSEQSGWDPYGDEMLRETYVKTLRDPFEEDSDSFTPASLTSGLSPFSNDCRSSGSGSHNNIGTERSSMATDSEVTSDSNAPVRKRKKTTGRLLADIVGQEKESEVLDRPARKRRYRSLSDLLRQLR